MVLVKAGRLVDTDAGTVQNDQNILIRDGKIEAVGKKPADPSRGESRDLSTMTVLGLIDCQRTWPIRQCGSAQQSNENVRESAFEAIPNAGKELLSASRRARCRRVLCLDR